MGIIQPLGPDGNPLGLAVTGSFAMMYDPDKKDGSHSNATENSEDAEADKIKKTKQGIILDPQPSEDIKDPLNWPIWRRDLALLCMGFHCFIGGGQISMLSAGFTQLSEELNVPRSQISYLVGFMSVSLAVGSVFASPTAVLFGKRGVYLTGLLISLVGLIISAYANSFKLVLLGRMVAGFGLSTVESLPSATVAEIYFAHERAYRLGIYTFLFLGGKNLVPLFSALVFEWFNRRVLFGGFAVITLINFILHILFVPETFWDRTPVPNERSLEETMIAREALASSLVCHVDDNSAITSISSSSFVGAAPATNAALPYQCNSEDYSPQSLGKESLNSPFSASLYSAKLSQSNLTAGLRLYHGRHSVDKWYMVMLRPFILVSYPAVLFSALLYALALVFMIIISQVMDFGYKSRYSFHSLQVGLIYIAPFIGGCAGSLVIGKVSDKFARYFASKNHGIYEPEFRLVMVLPAVLFTVTGLLGFGWSLERDNHWMVPTFFFGILAFGASMGSTTVITFTIDSYKMYAQEALVTLNIFKNLTAFAVSFFNVKFTEKAGYGIPFVCYALCEVCVGLCAIPLYRWGKTFRAWTDAKGILEFSYREKKKAATTLSQ